MLNSLQGYTQRETQGLLSAVTLSLLPSPTPDRMPGIDPEVHRRVLEETRDLLNIRHDDESASTRAKMVDFLGNQISESVLRGADVTKIKSRLNSARAGIAGAEGGLIDVLVEKGVPQEHAEYYAEGVRRGGTLVTVNAPDDQAEEAVDILDRHGAMDIEERVASYRTAGYAGYSESAAPYTAEEVTRERDLYQTTPVAATTGTAHTDGKQAISIVVEELAVGKRQIQRGGVRVFQHVEERPVSEQVTLHEEHVTVQRQAVDRPVTSAAAAFKEGTIEVTETAEVPVVAKEAHVVEEVVGKTATDRTETISDTIRRTGVEVEEVPDTTMTNWR